MTRPLRVRRLRPQARLPYRASEGAAAYDLCACLAQDAVIPPGGTLSVPTGIALELPGEEYVALVFSRSGHGFKHGVSLVNSVGVIDSDYRGEISVGLVNNGPAPFTVRSGDRIAQLMITNCFHLPIEEVECLGETARGAGGFGSTGSR